MKRIVLPLALAVFALSACTASSAPSTPSEVPSSAPSLSSGPSPSSTPFPPTSPSPGHATNAACDEVAFYLDPELGSGYACEVVPASDPGFCPEPRHLRIKIEGYSVPPSFEEASRAEILVYWARDVSSSELEGGYGPVPDGCYAGQTFTAQHKSLSFLDHDGTRSITEFRQDIGAPSFYGVLYTYIGATHDGGATIAAIFDINNSVLEDGGGGWSDWSEWDQWCVADYETCLSEAADLLNAQSADSFTPNLDALDALVASITITP